MFGQTTEVEKPWLAHEAQVAQRHARWLAAHPQPQ
jgi:hypothetical protein